MEPLGRGLESLIPAKAPEEIPEVVHASEETLAGDPKVSATAPIDTSIARSRYTPKVEEVMTPRRGESVFWIEIDKIDPNPLQPRREFDEEALKNLADSIRAHGVLQPVLVCKREEDKPTGLDVRYELIAGERRMRAARLAGLSSIPAVIRVGMPADQLKLELALIENVQREDLNPMERAKAFKQLIDQFHLLQREIAVRIGKSREVVANSLRLFSLPENIQEAIGEGRIAEGHARAILLAGDDPVTQQEVFNAILIDRLNVREAENRARHIGGKVFIPRKRHAAVQDPQIRAWQNRLQEQLGTKVRFEKLGDRGKIVVEFYSDEELRGILEKLIQEA